MIISVIIILACFVGSILLIITRKLNRAIAVLAGALITYFTLIFIEKMDFSIFIDFLFGTSADSYVNLRALVLIIGMLFIVQVCHSAGVFQFIGFKLIQISKGRPLYLLLVFCLLSLVISAILSNILAVIILIPLTIVASLILGIDPSPYIIAEAIMVNVGGILFSISSIPNILITTYTEITFTEFFLNVGLFALVLFGLTMVFFHFFYRSKLMIPKEKLKEVLQDFNVWNYVPSKPLFYRSIAVLLIVMVCFAAIPQTILTPDIIAMTGGISLVIMSKLDGKNILKNIDLELLFYLLGIFVITGAMEYIGVLDLAGAGITAIVGNNSFLAIIVILWVSAFLSSSIDNIPITKVLIPVVGSVSAGFSPMAVKSSFYSLAFGANLGDNLTPLGDNVLVMNLAEQHDRPISYAQFLRLGFTATIIQLIAVSLFFTFLNELTLGIIILFLIILLFYLVFFVRYLKKNVKREEELIFLKIWKRIKKQDYRKDKRLVAFKISRSIKKLFQEITGLGRKKDGI